MSGPGSDGFYVHDFPHADGTEENGVDDFNAAIFPKCDAIRAVSQFDSKCMSMTVGAMLGASRCLNAEGELELILQSHARHAKASPHSDYQ